MRRIAIFGVGILSSFGLLAAGAPAAHADTTLFHGEVTVTVPSTPSHLLTVCLTVHELNFGPACVGVL